MRSCRSIGTERSLKHEADASNMVDSEKRGMPHVGQCFAFRWFMVRSSTVCGEAGGLPLQLAIVEPMNLQKRR